MSARESVTSSRLTMRALLGVVPAVKTRFRSTRRPGRSFNQVKRRFSSAAEAPARRIVERRMRVCRKPIAWRANQGAGKLVYATLTTRL